MLNHMIADHGMTRRKILIATSLFLFISFASLYLLFTPSLASQPWDSLSYAYSAEVDGIEGLWGNHPLGHALFYTIFVLAQKVGYQGRALTLFQVTNGVLSGMIIGIFFLVLVYIVNTKPQYALGFSVILGASYSFWFFAGTADIYQFAIFSSLLAWAVLVYEITLRKRSLPVLSGVFCGLSVLFHQLNVALVPGGLSLIFLTSVDSAQAKKIKIKQGVWFTGLTSMIASAGYLLLGFVATSSLSLARVIGWMHGYFGDPTYGRYLATSFLVTAWGTLSRKVLFSSQTGFQAVSHGLLVFFLLMLPLGLLVNKAHDGRKWTIMKASALECLITWPLILWWEPQNPKFWLLMLLPWIIFLALAFEAAEVNLKSWLSGIGDKLSQTVIYLPVCIGLVILALNLHSVESQKDVDAFNAAMDVWMNNSSADDVLITAGDLVPHLMYWGKRQNTVYLYRSLQASQNSPDDFHDLRNEIDQAICSHHTVLITPTAGNYMSDSQLSLVGVSRTELHTFLDGYAQQGRIAFWYRDLFDKQLLPVYALKQSSACEKKQ